MARTRKSAGNPPVHWINPPFGRDLGATAFRPRPAMLGTPAVAAPLPRFISASDQIKAGPHVKLTSVAATIGPDTSRFTAAKVPRKGRAQTLAKLGRTF